MLSVGIKDIIVLDSKCELSRISWSGIFDSIYIIKTIIMKKMFIFILIGVLLVIVAGVVWYMYSKKSGGGGNKGVWEYKPKSFEADGMNFMSGLGSMSKSMLSPAMAPVNNSIGLSTGGAKDVNNFRENIKNGFFPQLSDITYEGLFYDYFFDTGNQTQCNKLFCPSYSMSISPDPFSKKDEYYMTVGLNSGIKESDFKRKKLNLVVVMDISGSMGSPFDSYYYDKIGKQEELTKEENEKEKNKTKMQVANESVTSMLDHLDAEDRFGMVLFDDQAYLGMKISKVGDTDMSEIKKKILEIKEQGSTDLETGFAMGTSLFKEFLSVDKSEYENRIIVLTDAMPNTGLVGKQDFMSMTSENADKGIFTTFVGIGVDFNTDLIEKITKVKGANYYSVHSPLEFKKRLDDEFEYMVTPLVFDLKLAIEAPGWQIEKVFGSPEADEATGEIMKINTLFPSKNEDGQTKGGVVLLRLKKNDGAGKIVLKTSYTDRKGQVDGDEQVIDWSNDASPNYDNTGIRKAILLTRYVNLIKNWVIDERREKSKVIVKPLVNERDGILLPPDKNLVLSEWERQSVPLTMSESYKKIFTDFVEYFKSEEHEIDDESLNIEVELMQEVLKK